MNVICGVFLFAANSLVRWWYREAYIKPWQPNSPDTSQSGKIFLFIYLVIQTVYTFFWATKYNVAVKDVLNIIWMLFVGFFCLQPTVSSEVGDTEKHTSSHGSQTPLAERTPNREVKIFIIIDLFRQNFHWWRHTSFVQLRLSHLPVMGFRPNFDML